MAVHSTSGLQRLPGELLTSIFGLVRPQDIRSLSLACAAFRDAILGNKMLFKAVYLQLQDLPPKEALADGRWDWEAQLHAFTKLRKLLSSLKYGREEKKAQIQHVSALVTQIARLADPKTSHSLNVTFLQEHFEQAVPGNINIELFGCQSAVYARARMPLSPHSEIPYLPFEDRQASAKLHVFHGAPIWRTPRLLFADVYPFAISKVYDLRNYTSQTLWGPFLPDGKATVDWEKMEAAMIVLGQNVTEFAFQTTGVLSPLWYHEWDGVAPGSFMNRSFPRPLEIADVGFEDPYNVTGSYLRVVCFLDFHELFRYNFVGPPLPDDEPREPRRTVEAVRLIMMELQVTHREDPGPEDGQDLPVIHFTGISRSMHSSWDPNANSSIRGTVRQTKEGEIRWTTISVFQGEERWKSECIQIGGANTARGVLGHWFDKDWNVHGPAGPTVFWKISNDIDDKSKKRRASQGASDDSDEEADEMVQLLVEEEEEEEEEEEVEDDDEHHHLTILHVEEHEH